MTSCLFVLCVITFYTNFSDIGELKWIADKQVSRPFETSWTSSFGGVCLGQYSFGLHRHVQRSSDMTLFTRNSLLLRVCCCPKDSSYSSYSISSHTIVHSEVRCVMLCPLPVGVCELID